MNNAFIRASIVEQTCWLCQDGRVFVALPHHLIKRHDINMRELRDSLLIPRRVALSSVEHREAAADRARSRDAVAAMRGAQQPSAHDVGPTLVAANAAKARRGTADDRRARMQAVALSDSPEDRRRRTRIAGLAVTQEMHSTAGRLGGKRRAAQLAEDPEARASLIAKREANATPEYRASRLAALAKGRETQAKRRTIAS